MDLFINIDSALIACFEHAGMYLRSAVAASPRDCEWWTPLGTWRRVEEIDRAEHIDALDCPIACEVCGLT